MDSTSIEQGPRQKYLVLLIHGVGSSEVGDLERTVKQFLAERGLDEVSVREFHWNSLVPQAVSKKQINIDSAYAADLIRSLRYTAFYSESPGSELLAYASTLLQVLLAAIPLLWLWRILLWSAEPHAKPANLLLHPLQAFAWAVDTTLSNYLTLPVWFLERRELLGRVLHYWWISLAVTALIVFLMGWWTERQFTRSLRRMALSFATPVISVASIFFVLGALSQTV
jgi:hypothetical protein